MDIPENIDFDNLVMKIFREQPRPKNSINIVFGNGEMNLKDLFEKLLMVFMEGMKVLYSNSNGTIDLSSISNRKLEKFNEYMNSFGLQVYIDKSRDIEKDYSKIKYTNININNKTKLNELKLPILSQNVIYVISFDFIM